MEKNNHNKLKSLLEHTKKMNDIYKLIRNIRHHPSIHSTPIYPINQINTSKCFIITRVNIPGLISTNISSMVLNVCIS